MGKYQDINCPICNKPLENGEPIAICPDCGAPYHKACIEESKTCIFDDLHAAGKSWQAPKKETSETHSNFTSSQPKRCSRCGSINPANGLFCEICGAPLNKPETQQTHTNQTYRPNINDPKPGQHAGPYGFPGQAPGQMPNQQPRPNQMPFGVSLSPFGDLKPDDKIDDIPVQEWAMFIGQNIPYYLPKFKAFSEKKRTPSFNFAAFFFNGFYFLYRKMNLLGLLIVLLTVVLQIPGFLINYDTLRVSMDPTVELLFSSDAMLRIANIFSVIRWIVMFLCGFFANKLYKNHCQEKIAKLKAEHTDHKEYVSSLTKQGSVSRTLILVLLGAYFLFSFLLSYLTVSQLL